MHRHRMLDGGFEQFGLGVRAEGDGAIHLAREGAAVDVFPLHHFLL
jgi:hypothetical protein